MTTRRDFLKGATASGIAFCSCSMLEATRAQPGPIHLPVKVGGKRVMTVDAHSHCYFHETLNLLGEGGDRVLPAVKKLKPLAEEAGCSLTQFSLAWVLREPNVASAIVGASRPDQLDENAAASGLEVDPALFAQAEAIVAGVERVR